MSLVSLYYLVVSLLYENRVFIALVCWCSRTNFNATRWWVGVALSVDHPVDKIRQIIDMNGDMNSGVCSHDIAHQENEFYTARA